MLPALEARGLEPIAAYPFLAAPYAFNFIELGRLAGLGGPSILGVLVHPVYGPWIAFRAAILLDADLDYPGEAAGFDPCPSCTVRSCMASCPVGAVTPASGWDVPRCARHRVEVEADCAERCHARVGCVLGPNHRYPDEELAYHQRRSLPAMRSYYEAGADQTKREDSE
jgi:epoxyqueuosine reductase